MTRYELLNSLYQEINKLPDKYFLEVLINLKSKVGDSALAQHIENIIKENRELYFKLAK